ncbi:hypothetical protein AUP95_22860 [Escherichia coli]|nr:hypothetical protein AUP95_22860 [Escherichia coli]GDM43315.1 hypothetical protein BvCmsKSP081_05326 [Escherichia coli]
MSGRKFHLCLCFTGRYFTYCLSMYIRSTFIIPMKFVNRNPLGKVIRELNCEQEMAVKTVCGLKKSATKVLYTLTNDRLREMREYDVWLLCD